MKRIPRFLVILLLFLCLPIVVEAHKGKTDSSGGHTDHSTGKYHYHHGYSAHSHYDMDGDGDADCPYDFKDKTNHSESGSASSVKTSSEKMYISKPTEEPIARSTPNKKEVKQVPTWIYWAFFGLFFIIIILLNSNQSKKDKIAEIERRHRFEVDDIIKSCDAKIAEKQASDEELKKIKLLISEERATERKLSAAIYSERKDLSNIRRMRCMAKNAPLEISFSSDGMPIYWKHRSDKPYGDYTVFISLNSGVYHTDSLCAGYRSRKEHIFNVVGRARPCKKCAVDFYNFTSAPDWYVKTE